MSKNYKKGSQRKPLAAFISEAVSFAKRDRRDTTNVEPSPHAILITIQANGSISPRKDLDPKLFIIEVRLEGNDWKQGKVEDHSHRYPRRYEQGEPWAKQFVKRDSKNGLTEYALAAQWYQALIQLGIKRYLEQ